MTVENSNSPTPYPDVNAFLKVFLDNAKAVLGNHFIGMYLYGSLACGDFDPNQSDIDPLIVTKGELPSNLVLALENMHTRIYNSGLKWATQMTGAYIPFEAMRSYSPNGPECPLFG